MANENRATVREKIVEQLVERLSNIVENFYLVADQSSPNWNNVVVDGSYVHDYPSAWNVTADATELTFTPRQTYRQGDDDLTPIIVPYTIGGGPVAIGSTGLTIEVTDTITDDDLWVLRANQSAQTVKNVFPWYRASDKADELPHVMVFDGEENKSPVSLERYDCELNVAIVLNVDPEDRSDLILHKLEGEVELEFNRDINLRTTDCSTKLSRNLWVTGSNLLFTEGSEEIVGATIFAKVLYHHAFRDPKEVKS